jgi:hypothetical protein
MKRNFNRDLLVLLNDEFMSEHAIEQEVECLHGILVSTESFDSFKSSHELIRRNRITAKAKALRKIYHTPVLKPFYFLLNRN